MKKIKSITTLLLFLLLFIFTFTSCSNNSKIEDITKTNTTHDIVDLSNRKVTLPTSINRVAALMGPAYEKVFMLGGSDSIILTNKATSTLPWAVKTNPKISNIPTVTTANNPNTEELLNAKTQVVFFWNFEEPIKAMNSSHIPVIVVASSTDITNVDEYVQREKDTLMTYANVLGEDAIKKANKWNDYFDQKIKYVTSRTKSLTADEIKSVYYASSKDGFECFTKNSAVQFLLEIAGGTLISKDIDTGSYANVTMEQIIAWNPNVIFTGRMTSSDLIYNDTKWNSLAAVKNNAVITSPMGVMYWDGSTECPLLLEYMAKSLHPELFTDLDMVKEVKEYYKEFYSYDLNDDNANRILNHLDPA